MPFVKGQIVPGRGRPKGSKAMITLYALRDALKVVESETIIDKDGKETKRVPILVHAWRRAYDNDAVLTALLRKFVPDAETVEEMEEKLIDQQFEFSDEPKRVNGRFNRFYN